MIRWWPLQCENKLINTACVPHYWVSSERRKMREKSRKLEFSLTHFTRSSSPTAATGISFVSNLIVSLFIWAKLLRISQSPVCRLVEAPNSDGDRFHLCDECHFKLNGIKNIIQTFAVLSFPSVGECTRRVEEKPVPSTSFHLDAIVTASATSHLHISTKRFHLNSVYILILFSTFLALLFATCRRRPIPWARRWFKCDAVAGSCSCCFLCVCVNV